MVIAFGCFIREILRFDTMVVNLFGIVVSWYQSRKEGSAMSNAELVDPDVADRQRERTFRIQIDRVRYTVDQRQMTGQELRQVPAAAIGPERDLFEVVPGRPDRKIGDDDVVEIRNGLRFFTAPSVINPGQSWA